MKESAKARFFENTTVTFVLILTNFTSVTTVATFDSYTTVTIVTLVSTSTPVPSHYIKIILENNFYGEVSK